MLIKTHVLVVGPDWIADWTHSVVRALIQCKASVTTLLYHRQGPAKTCYRKIPGLSAIRPLYTWYEGLRLRQAILKAIAIQTPEIILILKGEVLNEDDLQAIRASTSAKLVTWWVDNPAQMPDDWWHFFAHVFCFDQTYVQHLQEHGHSASWLPCAGDPFLYSPSIPHDAYCGVPVFIGRHSQQRNWIAELPSPLLIGPGWKHASHEYVSPREAAKYYSSSPISLNCHSVTHGMGGLNTKCFEIPLAGGFQLLDTVAGMDLLFDPAQHVAVYASPPEALYRITEYLAKPEQRRCMIQAARTHVLTHHTYQHRMQTLLEHV